MIKYNDSNINDWYFAEDNIVKLYRNGAVVYYKVITSGDTPEYQVCYAVVDDISQYQDREFVDVFNKADEKWYKLNNLNQYEEYGVYGDSIASGGTSRLPQGYTEVEYIRNNNYNAYINTGVIPYDNTTNTYTITTKLTSEFNSNLGCATIISCENPVSPYYGLGYRYKCSSAVDELEFFGSNTNYSSSTVDNGDGTRTITFQSTGNTSWTISAPLSYFCSFNSTSYDSSSAYRFSDATIYSATVVKNGSTVRDFVPAKRDSDSVYGLYDLINDVFYTSPNGNNFSGGSAVSNVATYYEGKLAIVDGYEYQYSGNSWVNVGEVSGSTIDTIWLDPPSTNNGGAEFIIGHYWGEGYKMVFNTYLSGSYSSDVGSFWRWEQHTPIEFSFYSNGFYYDMHNPTSTSSPTVYTGDYSYRIMKNGTLNSYENGQILNIILTYGTVRVELESTGAAIVTASTGVLTQSWYNGLYQARIGCGNASNRSHFSRIQVYNANNELVNDLKFVKNASVTGSQELSLYDSVLNVKYDNVNSNTPTYHIVSESGGTEYPLYYDEIQDPPNNLTFSSMAEAEQYECPWVGMQATIDGNRYIFSGNSTSGYEWVEDTTHYLPDIPYSFNYNAKQYIASTYTIPQTELQLQNVDAVCNYGYKIVDHSSDGYISVTGNSRMILSGNNGTYLNRSNTQTGCTMTIVSKAKTTSGYSIFTDRNSSSRQYMYRQDKTYSYLCGTGATSNFTCSDSVPNILSVRVYYDNGIKAKWNNWTTNTSSTPEEYAYNNQNLTNGGALFCDYSNSNGEFWQGDFYWIYMSQNLLTDEQIQQVIDYNENL